jgi:23S rRNA (uracil1939-C5)-methyltransferase
LDITGSNVPRSETKNGAQVLLCHVPDCQMRLTIEKLVFGGQGLARTPDGVVFVDGVLPGEIVEAETTGRQGGAPVATVRQLLQPSAERVVPACPHAAVCGGCDAQYIEPAAQVHHKQAIFVECLQRIGKQKDLPPVDVFASEPWQYRIRAQLQIDRQAGAIGFFGRASNDVVAIDRCPLLVDSLNRVLDDKETVMARLPEAAAQLRVFAGDSAVASAPAVAGVSEQSVDVTVGGCRFRVGGETFFQSNRFMVEPMGAWAKAHARGETLIDMFGGIGFFALQVAGAFERVLIVEADATMAEAAGTNAKLNQCGNIEVLQAGAEAFFGPRHQRRHHADCLIVDPPRTGLSREVRSGIATTKPPQILYIACDPASQARDVHFLTTQAGYHIEKAAMFDCYPQTHHLETGLDLRR